MTEYTCGFYFTPGGRKVLLVRKAQGPEAVKGRWNGIGGKVEVTESWRECLAREFKEETEIELDPKGWRKFCVLSNPRENWRVVFFARFDGEEGYLTTPVNDVNEPLAWHDALKPLNVVKNLWWLIPMAFEVYGLEDKKFFYNVTEERP